MSLTHDGPDAIRHRLAPLRGRQYWRSLDELAQTPEFESLLQREFPREASVLDSIGRRSFLKVMGASLALAGLSGCGEPAKHLVPYVATPPDLVQGKPQYFTTAITLGGVATGVMVESNMGRPTKIEGNPSHPGSLGATDIFSQAAILSLYDPERSQAVLNRNAVSTWSRFLESLEAILADPTAARGQGIRILTEAVTSPTLAAQLNAFLARYPDAKWHQYEPVNRDNARAGAELAFGADATPLYHFDRADVIVALDADFLSSVPGNLRYIRDFSARRRVRDGRSTMNRLYAFESNFSLTGSVADHRWPVRSSLIKTLAWQLAARLRIAGASEHHVENNAVIPDHDLDAIVADLQKHRGGCLVLAGAAQPPIVHALAHAMNAALGNVGSTVNCIGPIEEAPVSHADSIRALASDLHAGTVGTLLVIGGDPVYTAPADLDFEAAFQKAATRIHMGLYRNATAALSHWHIPQSHELETWSDTRAFDGTVTIQQPLILPLYGGRSTLELLAWMNGARSVSSYELVREQWRAQLGSDFERAWRQALSDGVVPATQRKVIATTMRNPLANGETMATQPAGLEINFLPDPTVWDGRFVNNAWLQELPKPLTKLTWDNAVLISPATAAKLGLVNGDSVEVTCNTRRVTGAVWILPGHAADALTLHLGYGQSQAGRVGLGTGFNAYSIRTTNALDVAAGAQLRKTGASYPLACTQEHFSMEGRDLVVEAPLEEFSRDPEFLRKRVEAAPATSLYPEKKYEGHAWGMVIDTGACTGCSACVIACQSENNIPVVGKEQVLNSREMHWIRVDRYFSGDLENPEASVQPVPCMHCENAPCELVCPVQATTHSGEGLNEMTYNRCIGTRYCSNNCPYKVRRFNFLEYSALNDPALRLRANPEVTVRERGVMEKCTYCVQRISRARIGSEIEHRALRDGEITPACAQACPSEAIVFGDINDAASRVAKLKASPLNYGLLEELNTRPRTTYLARIRNPNPEIKDVAETRV